MNAAFTMSQDEVGGRTMEGRATLFLKLGSQSGYIDSHFAFYFKL